ncbi:MAG: 16S rRNA (cytidine(1402)-2'-O)-methyltransferase [Polyangiaceae bacterium]
MALYVVATPIGNLDDLTLRARRVLSDAALVVAEDTRRTRALLAHLGLEGKALRRVDAHATEHDVAAVVDVLREGSDVALVTDAGTPAVSDPGPLLVAGARAAGVRVVPIPGPSAVTAAISASGYAIGAFRFVGFLPRSGAERTAALADLAAARDAVVLFEAPSRLSTTLSDLAAAMPGRRALVARELTKLHEELLEGALDELAETFAAREPLGELTLVLAPWAGPERAALSEDELLAMIDAAIARGGHPKAIAEEIALASGRPKRDVYALVVHRRRGSIK